MGAGSEQPPKKRLKNNDNKAAKNNKRKRQNKRKAAVKKERNQFAVSFREDNDDSWVADVIAVDDDDSDDRLIEGEALNRLRRKALLERRAKESKEKLTLEKKRQMLRYQIRDQAKEWLDRVRREEKQHKDLEVRQ